MEAIGAICRLHTLRRQWRQQRDKRANGNASCFVHESPSFCFSKRVVDESCVSELFEFFEILLQPRGVATESFSSDKPIGEPIGERDAHAFVRIIVIASPCSLLRQFAIDQQ